MPDLRCAAIVLAAGASTRLGRPKQLLRIEGEPLLRRTARLAVEAGCSPAYVVLGFEAEPMRRELADLAGVAVVLNKDWQEGMGSSLRAGMEAVRNLEPQPDAVLLLVCDQPRLTADHLRRLLAQHKEAQTADGVRITASVYARRAGVPAIFSGKLFGDLAHSSGDRGARNLIRAHADELGGIPWPEGELDVDRPEDLATIEP